MPRRMKGKRNKMAEWRRKSKGPRSKMPGDSNAAFPHNPLPMSISLEEKAERDVALRAHTRIDKETRLRPGVKVHRREKNGLTACKKPVGEGILTNAGLPGNTRVTCKLCLKK